MGFVANHSRARCLFAVLAAVVGIAVSTSAWATTYYSRGSLSPSLTTSWNTIRTGGGSQPPDFISGDLFVIQNLHNMTTTAAWTVSGTGAKIEIESGGTLTATSLVSVPTFQLDNNSNYVHNVATTPNGSATDIPGSTTRTFAMSSTVEIQKWGDGTGSSPVALPSGVTWGNLKINVATLGGSWNQSGTLANVANKLTIQATGGGTNEFRLSANSPATATSSILILQITGGIFNVCNGTAIQTVRIAGDFTQSGGTFKASGNGPHLMYFIGGGSGTFTVSGGTFDNTHLDWRIDSAKALFLATNFGAGGWVANGRTMTVEGFFYINQGAFPGNTGTWTYTSTGAIDFNNSSGSYIVNNDNYWPAVNGPTSVFVSVGGGITMNVARTVSTNFSIAAPVLNGNNLTLPGTTQLNAGSITGAPTYGPSATLIYDAVGPSIGRGDEWSATSGPGYPINVKVSGSTTFNLGANGGAATARQMGGNLTIDFGSTFSMNVSGSEMTAPLTVLGNIQFTGTLALSSLAGGDIKVGGASWANSNGTLQSNNGAVIFNRNGSQTISSVSGTEKFGTLVVDKPAGNLNFSSGTNVQILGTSGNVLQIINAGAINYGGTLTMLNNGGNILVGGTAVGNRTITGNGSFIVSGSKTVTNNNGKTLTFDTAVTVQLTSGIDFGAGLSTVLKTLQIASGGVVNTNPPTYGSASLLQYSSGGTYGRGAEWSATAGPGYPNQVQVSSSTTLDLGANGGAGTARQCAGSLTIDVGSALTMNGASPMTAALTVLGNVTNNGTLTLSSLAGGDLVTNGSFVHNSTFNGNGRAVFFRGAAIQTVSRPGGLTIDYIRIEKSGGSVKMGSNLTCTGPAGGNALEYNGTVDVLDLNGNTLTLGGSGPGGTDAFGVIKGSATSNLAVTGGGSYGPISFDASGQSLNNLTIDRTAEVSIETNLTVNGVLQFVNGKVGTGGTTLTIAPSGTVLGAGSSSYVDGILKKRVTILGGAGSQTFEVGDASYYTPVSFSTSSGSASFDIAAGSFSGTHPFVGSSGLDPARSLNRYYSVSATPTGQFSSATLTFNFDPSDVVGGASPTRYYIEKFDFSSWTPVTVGTRTSTSIEATGVNGFSVFQIGELANHTITPTAGAGGSIDPSAPTTVPNGGSQTFTISPTDKCSSILDVHVDGVSVGAVSSYTFNDVRVDHTIDATFSTFAPSTITASAGAGGSITPSGVVSVACGGSQSYAISPSGKCGAILDVKVDGFSVGAVGSYTFSDVQANHTIDATFTTLGPSTITATAGAGGSIAPSGAVSVACGGSQTFSVSPADKCHAILDVKVDGVSVGAVATYTFNDVQVNHTLDATFSTLGPFTITATAGAGGSISPSGAVSVSCGDNQTFSIAAAGCFHTIDVKVDAISVGVVATYAFNDVQSNHTLSATFAPNAVTTTAVTDLAAAQQRFGNDGDGTSKITVTYSMPAGAVSVEVWRKGYGGYPTYDDGGGSVPSVPGSYPPSGWTLTSVSASGQTDEPATRDFWYYVAYAKDACGNVAPVSGVTNGNLNYHLGDVSDGITAGQGDNLVSTPDVSLLGAHYGATGATLVGYEYLDVGPTTDFTVNTRPTTDGVVDFDDLVMFALNHVPNASLVESKTPVQAAASDLVRLETATGHAIGETFEVRVHLAGAGDLQALSTSLKWNASVVTPVSSAAGAMLTSQNGVMFPPKLGTLDAAILGVGSHGLIGEGVLATIEFKVIGAGDPAIAIDRVIGRDAANRNVAVEIGQPLSVQAPIRVTMLAPVTPNPAHGSVLFSYSVAKRTAVELAVFSVDGRRLKTLASGVQEVGLYQMRWDGTDERGQALRSGVFYIRFDAAGKRQTRTITLVR